MAFDLTSYKGIFFDIYGTLIQWEEGLFPHLLDLSRKLPNGHPRREDTPENRQKLLQSYSKYEQMVEHENPTMKYPKILETVYDRIAAELGVQGNVAERAAFGRTIGDWAAFPDTLEAMKVLAQYYKLFVLSNVDNESFERTLTGPLKGIHWDGIYTAEDIGSYKPHPNNYNYVVEKAKQFGIQKDELLLVAQSLDVDHQMARKLNFRPSVWIARSSAVTGGIRQEMEARGELNLGAIYETLGEMAEAVENAWSHQAQMQRVPGK
ncbi:hypothetical protein RBB50_011404 [Rhinocladiella similis]